MGSFDSSSSVIPSRQPTLTPTIVPIGVSLPTPKARTPQCLQKKCWFFFVLNRYSVSSALPVSSRNPVRLRDRCPEPRAPADRAVAAIGAGREIEIGFEAHGSAVAAAAVGLQHGRRCGARPVSCHCSLGAHRVFAVDPIISRRFGNGAGCASGTTASCVSSSRNAMGSAAKGQSCCARTRSRAARSAEPLFDVSKISELVVLDQRFERPGPNYRKNDSAMKTIFAAAVDAARAMPRSVCACRRRLSAPGGAGAPLRRWRRGRQASARRSRARECPVTTMWSSSTAATPWANTPKLYSPGSKPVIVRSNVRDCPPATSSQPRTSVHVKPRLRPAPTKLLPKTRSIHDRSRRATARRRRR